MQASRQASKQLGKQVIGQAGNQASRQLGKHWEGIQSEPCPGGLVLFQMSKSYLKRFCFSDWKLISERKHPINESLDYFFNTYFVK